MKDESAQARLAKVIKSLSKSKKSELDKLKANYADLERPDFLWHYLLQSFSTMGRSSGWYGLIGNKNNYNRVTFEAIKGIPAENRQTEVSKVCRTARIRMPDKKAQYIIGCFKYVTELGGPVAAKAALLSKRGRDAKIQFLKAFPGIGDKYARNIMMDVYHDDFRDSIAIDTRIKSVTEKLGLTFRTYSEHEEFYLEVASQAGVNGWELDRIIYNYQTEVENNL